MGLAGSTPTISSERSCSAGLSVTAPTDADIQQYMKTAYEVPWPWAVQSSSTTDPTNAKVMTVHRTPIKIKKPKKPKKAKKKKEKKENDEDEDGNEQDDDAASNQSNQSDDQDDEIEESEPLSVELLATTLGQIDEHSSALITLGLETTTKDGLAAMAGSLLASFAKLSGFDIAKGKPKESLRMASRPALGLTQLGYQAAQLKNRVDAVWMVELPNTTVQSPAAAPKPVLSPASSAAAARTHDLELLLDIYATLRWFVAKMIPEGRRYGLLLPLIGLNSARTVAWPHVVQEMISFAYHAAKTCPYKPNGPGLTSIKILLPSVSLLDAVESEGFTGGAKEIFELVEEIELDLFPFVQRLIRWRKAALKDGLYKGMKDVDTLNDQISIVCSALDQRGGGADPETAGRSNFVLEARKENQSAFRVCTAAGHFVGSFLHLWSHVPGFDAKASAREKIAHLRQHSIAEFKRMAKHPSKDGFHLWPFDNDASGNGTTDAAGSRTPSSRRNVNTDAESNWSIPARANEDDDSDENRYHLSYEAQLHAEVLDRLATKAARPTHAAILNVVDIVCALQAMHGLLKHLDLTITGGNSKNRTDAALQYSVSTGLLLDSKAMANYLGGSGVHASGGGALKRGSADDDSVHSEASDD